MWLTLEQNCCKTINPLAAAYAFICDARLRQAIVWLIPFAATRHNYGVSSGCGQCFDLSISDATSFVYIYTRPRSPELWHTPLDAASRHYYGVGILYFPSPQVLTNNGKYNSLVSLKILVYKYIVVNDNNFQ